MTEEEIEKSIPDELYELASIFSTKAHLYIVGGFIRDIIAFNKISKDIDIASSLTPQELEEILNNTNFKISEASKRLGTMIIHGKYSYEYTTFRVDSYPVNDGVHEPSFVEFTKDIESDAKRRDFKCNAIYYDLNEKKIVDPLYGLKDIDKKLISCVIDPFITLSQDGLRIMRLIRFVSITGFIVEKETFNAAKLLVSRLKDISVERIQVELQKILYGDYCYEALLLAKEIGVLNIIIPELIEGEGIKQNEKFHKYDVLEHTFQTVKFAPKHIRLAALFHDIAKPYCLKKDGNMYIHAQVGSIMAEKILMHYKFSNDIIKHTKVLIENHMFDATDTAKKYTIRKFILKNIAYIDDIIALQMADAIACGGVTPLRENKTKIELDYMRHNNIPTRLSELKINGKDLISLGYKGLQVGKMLEELMQKCILEEISNEREVLLEYSLKRAQKIVNKD